MTIGPWTENAMWTPDETPKPEVVSEHYYQVIAEVREDGSITFRIGELDSINVVYLVDKDEWVTTDWTEEIMEDEVRTYTNLERRLA